MTMIVINGIRYRREDAIRKGLIKREPEDVPETTPAPVEVPEKSEEPEGLEIKRARAPRNKARVLTPNKGDE